MTTLPLGEARDALSALVDQVERTHDRVTITRHGRPSAVLISAEDLDALEETLDILSTPGALAEIRAAQEEISRGDAVDAAGIADIIARRRETER
ncbi:type II toxin-antitoxin system Phd/YefM family antitoxin [Microtetraspora sp. NBRC 16547]|uniref:type II toxin-antitoxin system Phd/YefM family antitoxin n=1 Tax=Microtetraspora sp. NBRC 16547 TaxID=3030993 RepID=UPI0024A27A58|nr:type II toxin-antitoxin system Phd/YefM family antitoxin [Microtetraspora sp. NBRC 16547]GLX02824.1 antitoxin RelB [Microtetraspora sp. NBRC 16547]